MARSGAILYVDVERVPPHLYFVVSAVFHYLGPAFAVLLFARVDVLGVAWLRIASAALVFALWRRPWRAFARWTAPAAGCWSPGARCSRVMNVLLLRRDRPAAARHGRGDRVPPRDRAGRARRAHARATPPRSRSPCPGVYLLTGVQLEGEPLGVALRVRQRRAVRRSTSCSPTAWRGTRAQRHRRPRGLDAGRGGRRHAARRLGGAARRSPTRSRCSPASASGSASSVIPYVSDQLAMAACRAPPTR